MFIFSKLSTFFQLIEIDEGWLQLIRSWHFVCRIRGLTSPPWPTPNILIVPIPSLQSLVQCSEVKSSIIIVNLSNDELRWNSGTSNMPRPSFYLFILSLFIFSIHNNILNIYSVYIAIQITLLNMHKNI